LRKKTTIWDILGWTRKKAKSEGEHPIGFTAEEGTEGFTAAPEVRPPESEMQTLNVRQISAADDLINFNRHVEAHFGKPPTAESEVLAKPTVPATTAELYAHAKRVTEIVRTMMIRMASRRLTLKEKQAKAIASGMEAPKIKEVVTEIGEEGKHPFLGRLLRDFDESYHDNLRQIREQLEVLPADEVARRALNLQFEYLFNLVRGLKAAEAPFERTVGDYILSAQEAKIAANEAGLVTKDQYQIVIDRINRLEALPHGKDVIKALGKLVADRNENDMLINWVYGQLGGQMTKGGTDLLSEFGAFSLYERAAMLADPKEWAKAQAKAFAKDPNASNQKVASEYLRETEFKFSRAQSDIAIADVVGQKLKKLGLKWRLEDEAMKREAGEDVDSSIDIAEEALAGEMADRGYGGYVSVGSIQEQSIANIGALFEGGANLNVEGWKAFPKARVRFKDRGNSVNWERSRVVEERSKVSEELAERLNLAYNAIVSGEHGLKFCGSADGGLVVGFMGGIPTGVIPHMKLRILKAVKGATEERIAELERTKPNPLDIVEELKKKYTGEGKEVPEEGVLEKEAAALQFEANEVWKDKVHNSYSSWVSNTVKILTDRLQGAILKELEPLRPKPATAKMELPKTKPVAGISKGTAEALYALAHQLTDESAKLRLVAGTKAFLQDNWRRMGLSPEQGAMYTNIAMRLAASFPELGPGRLVKLAFEGGQYVGIGGRRWLAGIGDGTYEAALSPTDRARLNLVKLAHEFTHGVFLDKTSREAFSKEQQGRIERVIEQAEIMEPEDRAATVLKWMKIVSPVDDEGLALFRAELAHKSAQEYIADMGSLMTLGAIRPDVSTLFAVKNFGAEALFSSSHEQAIMEAFFVPMAEMAEVLSKLTNPLVAAEELKFIQGMRKVIGSNREAVESVLTAFDQLQQFNSKTGEYERLMKEGYIADPVDMDEIYRQYGMPTPATANMALPFMAAKRNLGFGEHAIIEKYFGLRPNWFERWFMFPSFTAERYPVLKDGINATMNMRSLANDAANAMAEPMMVETKGLGGVLWGRKVLDVEGTGLRHLFTHKQANEAASMAALMQQALERKLTVAEIKQIAIDHGVKTVEGQQRVVDFITNAWEVAPKVTAMKIESMRANIRNAVVSQLQGDHPTVKARDAKAAGTAAENAIWALLTQQDPVVIADMANRVAGLRSTLPKLDKALLLAKESLAIVKEFSDKFADQPWYMSEQRHGRFRVAFWDKQAGKFGYIAKDNATDFDVAVQALRQREARNEVSSIRTALKDDRNVAYSGMAPGLMQTLQRIEKLAQARGFVEAGFTGEEMQRLTDVYTPMDAALREVNEKTLERLKFERKLTPGRETLDMPLGFIRDIQSTAYMFAKTVTKGDVEVALADPAIRGEPAMVKMVREHYNMVANPSAKEFGFLKRFIFSMYMGFNFSSMLIEGTQPLLMLVPHITRDTGSGVAGYKYMGKALQSLVGKATTKKWADPVLEKYVKQAEKDALIDFGVQQEFHDVESMATLNTRSLLQGGSGAMNPVNWAKTFLDTYARVGRNIYSHAPRLNSIVSFISLFETARDHGVYQGGKLVKLDAERAYEYAKSSIRSVTLGGGLANRPLAFAKFGPMQGVAGLAYSLGTYTAGMVSHIARLGLDAIDKKFTGAERTAAVKALGQTLATQTALAGVMGLPMATATMAILEQMFPQLEVKKTVEETIAKLMSEDEENGGIMTDFALRGAPFAFGGVDLSSRLELSQLMGVSAYDGFQFKHLMGPSGSILENMIRAARLGVEGQYAEAGETILPTAWKNLVKSARDNWQVRDPQGRLVMDPTQTEVALDVIGFRPKRLVKMRDALRMAKKGEEAWALRNDTFHDSMAKEFLAGNIAYVQQKLMEQEDKVSGYSAMAGARAIVDRAVDQSLPYDWAREGLRVNAKERQKLAASAGVAQPTEVERMMTKKSLEAQLGLPGSGGISQTELKHAQIIDWLRAQNPVLSKQEASDLASVLISGVRQGFGGRPRFSPQGLWSGL